MPVRVLDGDVNINSLIFVMEAGQEGQAVMLGRQLANVVGNRIVVRIGIRHTKQPRFTVFAFKFDPSPFWRRQQKLTLKVGQKLANIGVAIERTWPNVPQLVRQAVMNKVMAPHI